MAEVGTRWICSILDDMKVCYKTRNFGYLPSLIEECRYRASRMENALEMNDSIESMEKERIELKKELGELREEVKELREEKGELKRGVYGGA